MTRKDASNYYIDAQMARLIAAQVALLLLLALFAGSAVPVYILLVDFALRAFTYQPSPLTAIARIVANLLGLRPKPVFAAPKRFAALVGFVLSLFLLLFLVLRWPALAYITGSILLACSLLEAVLQLCVGCSIYNGLLAPFINRRARKKQEITIAKD